MNEKDILKVIKKGEEFRQCRESRCFDFVFRLNHKGLSCRRCGTHTELREGEELGEYPRPERKHLDIINELPRYSFLLIDGVVQRVRRSQGHWLDYWDVMQVVDRAQREINTLRERIEEQQ